MKRLLLGGLAVGSLLFAATGVASANTASPLAKPTKVSLAKSVLTSTVNVGNSWPLATDPGKMILAFATPNPAELVSGAAVVCKPPTKNNPILIGEPGVGKTAIVEGLATNGLNEI